MTINFYEDKECQTCFRNFLKLDNHHINGNHKDNRNENLINVCRNCHTTIHKKIGIRKSRSYQDEFDERTVKLIYDLRLKLYKGKFGTIKFIPDDSITKIAKRIEFFDKLERNWANIKEIHYS